MTRQEMFDFAVGKVLAQGGPSFDRYTDKCMYRGPNERRCLVGWLIPDEAYSPAMENRAPTQIISDFGSARFDEDFVDQIHFLEALQTAHDHAVNLDTDTSDKEWWDRFKFNARETAERYGLSPAVLDRVDRLMDAVSAFSEGGDVIERESLVTA